MCKEDALRGLKLRPWDNPPPTPHPQAHTHTHTHKLIFLPWPLWCCCWLRPQGDVSTDWLDFSEGQRLADADTLHMHSIYPQRSAKVLYTAISPTTDYWAVIMTWPRKRPSRPNLHYEDPPTSRNRHGYLFSTHKKHPRISRSKQF